MKKVNPNSVPIPAEINYSNIKNEVLSITKSTNLPTGNIYRGSIRKNGLVVNNVSIALKKKYKSKCGYCECYEYNPKVEHHRPKGFVTDGGVKNKGYHWLAYEWTNMVASCTRCNDRPNKGTNFPVDVILSKRKLVFPSKKGKPDFENYRYNSTYLKSEKPKILHPEYCHPSRHLRFERDGEYKSITNLGQHSIDTYGLNDNTVVAERLGLYNNYLDRIKNLVRKRFRGNNPKSRAYIKEELGDIYVDLIKKANNDKKSFTFFRKEMYKKFNHFFIEPFPKSSIRKELKDIYLEILTEIK